MGHVNEFADWRERNHARMDLHALAEAVDKDAARAEWFRRWGAKVESILGNPQTETEFDTLRQQLREAERDANSADATAEELEQFIESALTALEAVDPTGQAPGFVEDALRAVIKNLSEARTVRHP